MEFLILYDKSEHLIRLWRGRKMVQYKKDEIKEKLEAAALNIFSENGYMNAKIADIASKAGVSVGNLYRYYKNKDELFYTIVPRDFTESFKNKLYEKIILARHKGLAGYKENELNKLLTNEFYGFLLENKERFIILIEHGQGTEYSGFKEELINYLIKIFMDNLTLFQKSESIMQRNLKTVLKIVYTNLINMFVEALKQPTQDFQKKFLLHALNSYHWAGLKELKG